MHGPRNRAPGTAFSPRSAATPIATLIKPRSTPPGSGLFHWRRPIVCATDRARFRAQDKTGQRHARIARYNCEALKRRTLKCIDFKTPAEAFPILKSSVALQTGGQIPAVAGMTTRLRAPSSARGRGNRPRRFALQRLVLGSPQNAKGAAEAAPRVDRTRQTGPNLDQKLRSTRRRPIRMPSVCLELTSSWEALL